jgi:hypothetical protein
MLFRLELQRFRKNCLDTVAQCLKYADLEDHLLGINAGLKVHISDNIRRYVHLPG